MRHLAPSFILAALSSAVACQPVVNTVPEPVSPTAAVQYFDLELPAGLEIRSADFSAAAFAYASGQPVGALPGAIGGRAFMTAYAVRRDTGEPIILLYEDIAHRRRPIQIIRFHPGADGVPADSTR